MIRLRTFVRGLASLALLCFVSVALAASAEKASIKLVNKQPQSARPLNVLVLMTDQHHAQWLGCAGHPIVKTPSLDRLARQGTRFTQAFVPAPFCSPTRASIETGLYPSALGIGRNLREAGDDPLGLREPRQVYQHPLAKLGYHCHQLGKWHIGDPAQLNCLSTSTEDEKAIDKMIEDSRKRAGASALDDGPRPGEVDLVGDVYVRKAIADGNRVLGKGKKQPIGRSRLKPEFHQTSVMTDYCIELLKRHQNEPFAITWSAGPPHAPWIAPSRFYDMYDPKQFVLPANWTNIPTLWKTSPAVEMGQAYGEEGIREYIRCYAAQITMIDWCVGRILDALDELNLSQNTLVVFTSDHGNHLVEHGFVGKLHGSFYDDLVRVPLLMRLPGKIPANQKADGYVSAVDLPVTILDYLGAPPLEKAQGRSMKGVLSDKDPGYSAVFSERGEPGTTKCSRMIRTHDWKLNVLGIGGRELFDLKKDPNENCNLAKDPGYAAIMAQLETQLRAHMMAIGDASLSQTNVAQPQKAAPTGKGSKPRNKKHRQ